MQVTTCAQSCQGSPNAFKNVHLDSAWVTGDAQANRGPEEGSEGCSVLPNPHPGVRAVLAQHLPRQLCLRRAPTKHSFGKPEELESRRSERDSSKQSWQDLSVLPRVLGVEVQR